MYVEGRKNNYWGEYRMDGVYASAYRKGVGLKSAHLEFVHGDKLFDAEL
jgi:hypothetical protein